MIRVGAACLFSLFARTQFVALRLELGAKIATALTRRGRRRRTGAVRVAAPATAARICIVIVATIVIVIAVLVVVHV